MPSSVTTLARFKNLYAKVDFIGTGTQMKYLCEDLHNAALRVIDAYGPERCVWASCFPNELWTPKITYQENLRIFEEALPLKQNAREWILGGTARKLWFPDLKV
jgi:predicted TIM-barrel fold metal-dependent hydrolase